jgi:dTDP-4-dehydrorhamnose reductase
VTHLVLLGSNGQVGQALQTQLPVLGQVTDLSREQLDLTHSDQIRQVISDLCPDVIVNAAAYTAVDKAESEHDLATAINGIAPSILAEMSQQLNATLIHISTDYVFNGRHYQPYSEDHTTDPLGVYGQSKRQGEVGILETKARAIILRTAWVYGTRGHGNFVKTMLRLGQEREEIRVVADQIGTPTWSADIASTICRLVAQSQTSPDSFLSRPEIYHFTNSGTASWYDFAVAIFEEAAHLGYALAVKRVIPITTAHYPTPAQRPSYSVLSNQKINQLLGSPSQHWRQALRKMLQELKPI